MNNKKIFIMNNKKIILLFFTFFNLFLCLGQEIQMDSIEKKILKIAIPEELQIYTSIEKSKRNFYSSESDKIRNGKHKPWRPIVNDGVILNISGLGCIDNYPSAGVGAELGFSYVSRIGFTFGSYIGGASNEMFWIGGAVGYTHCLRKIAPYGLIGFAAATYELEGSGTLELGSNFRLTSWLSFKPAIRIGLAKDDYTNFLYNYNVLLLSLTLDPFRLLPYNY
jgi:hypothetical protein